MLPYSQYHIRNFSDLDIQSGVTLLQFTELKTLTFNTHSWETVSRRGHDGMQAASQYPSTWLVTEVSSAKKGHANLQSKVCLDWWGKDVQMLEEALLKLQSRLLLRGKHWVCPVVHCLVGQG
jgi:hypothetical protein